MKKTIKFILMLIITNLMMTTIPLKGQPHLFPNLFQILLDYNGPKTFLLSYPCSGNTWTRYCLEYLTQRPSFQSWYADPKNLPLGWYGNFKLDFKKAPIQKAHDLKLGSYNKDIDQLILIIRNPKEAIPRAESRLDKIEHLTEEKKGKVYFDALETFDSWNPHNRILIYYEDLITNPVKTLEQLLLFLNESSQKLPSFMQDYEKHRKKALEIYWDSHSKGEDLLYHSKKIDPERRNEIDHWIEELYPLYWNKYLKDRYSESVIQY